VKVVHKHETHYRPASKRGKSSGKSSSKSSSSKYDDDSSNSYENDDEESDNDEGDEEDDDDEEDDYDESLEDQLNSDNFDAGFNPKESFALFNPHRSRCLAVKKGRKHNHILGTVKCDENQIITRRSKITFHFKPAPNNLAYLAWTDPETGRELCARREFHTRFYPCGQGSSMYALSGNNVHGQFHIFDATKGKKRRCFQSVRFKKHFHTSGCAARRRQAWRKLPVTNRSYSDE